MHCVGSLTWFFVFFVLGQAAYFLVRMMYYYDTFTKSSFVGLAWLSLVNYFCLTTIFSAADKGLPFT
jgi:hypothetical protein